MRTPITTYPSNQPHQLLASAMLSGLLLAGTLPGFGQTTPAQPAARPDDPNAPAEAKHDPNAATSPAKPAIPVERKAPGEKSTEEVVSLSPFEVSASQEEGYVASSSLAGTRLNTNLRDIASPIQVVTPQFLKDTGAKNINELLVYTTDTEVSGLQGNYRGFSAGDNGTAQAQLKAAQTGTRVRGLNEADQTRGFFLTDIPLDSYNVTTIDIQRGPNSILFGLGSPAGIINYTLKAPNLTQNKYGTELRVGSFGAHREALDVDQVIVDGTLGVRLNGLNNEERFRQDGRFAHQKRATVAARWQPKLGEGVFTQVTANFETGKSTSNRPRTAPPLDYISNWYDRLGKWSPTRAYSGWSGIEDKQRYLVDYQGTAAGAWWDQVGVIFSDPNSAKTGGPNEPDAMRIRGGTQSDGSWGGSLLGPSNPHENITGQHYLAQKSAFANNPKVMAIINAFEQKTGRSFNSQPFGGWQASQILDPSVFDYWNDSIEGPNDTQWNKFHALNLTGVQTYLHNDLGVEVAYDRQNYHDGDWNYVGDPTRLSIDINQNLRNGSPNPNYGRPYFASGAGGSQRETNREAVRATLYYKLDFKKLVGDGWVGRILGNHTLTGIGSRQDYKSFGYGWNLYQLGDAYAQYSGDESLVMVHYLNANVDPRNASTMAGLGIHGIDAVQQVPGTLNTSIQDQNRIKHSPVLADWSVVPLNVTSASSSVSQMYNGARAFSDDTATKAFVWQSRLFDDNVVGLFGVRQDNYTKWDRGNAPQFQDANGGYHDLPFSPDWKNNPAKTLNAISTTRSWGVMVHVPEFVTRHLPWGTQISFGVNHANNFRPSDVGFDMYGVQLPAPAGQSRDFSLLVSTLHNRLNMRMTWFTTTQKNTSYSGGPGEWAIRNRLARAMKGLMVETTGNGSLGLRQTLPESVVNKWFFGDKFDTTIAAQPLPSGWTVQNHPELLNEPLRIRAAASTVTQGTLRPDGTPYTEPPISADEIAYRVAWFSARSDAEWFRPFNTVAGLDLAKGLGFARKPYAGGGFEWNYDLDIPSYKNTADITTKGMELELAGNITPQWRTIFNASRAQAVTTNILGGNMDKYIAAMRAVAYDGFKQSDYQGGLDYWHRTGFAHIDPWGNNNSQYLGTDWNRDVDIPYLTAKSAEGRAVGELRKWHWNLISTYDFHRGPLKGFGVGGSVRYQGPLTVGYYPTYLDSAGVWISDLNNPIMAPSQTNYDAWITYRRKLTKRVTMECQLNVRNLFKGKELIPINANPDGSYGQYRMAEGTTWEFTNRFMF